MRRYPRVLVLTGLALTLASSVACEPPVASIDTIDGTDADSTTDPTTSGASTTGDTDTSNTSTQTTPRTWTGERDFFFDWCEDTIYGDGQEVTDDPAFGDALAACPECDEIYAVDHSPEVICYGYIGVKTESIRGVNRTSGALFEVVMRDNGYVAEELAQGNWTGNKLEYGYLVDEGWEMFEVIGWATAE